jgi:hypothetical protein
MNTTVKADTAILLKASEIYTAALDDIKPCEGLMCSLTLQPYPMSLLKRSAAYGGNSLGLDTDNGPLVSILLLTYWKRKEDDERVLSITRGVLEHIDREAQKSKTGVRFKYLNYAAEFQNPIESYGDENMKRLREVSRKYDPAGLFQDSVPGGCKLFS